RTMSAAKGCHLSQPEQLSSRLQALKDDLVNIIPMQKQADRVTLSSKQLTDVIIQYLTWRARLIRPQPRSVVIWPDVTSSPHYAAQASNQHRDGDDRATHFLRALLAARFRSW